MNRRSRSACVASVVLTVLLTAGPAFARDFDPLGRDEGAEPGAGQSPLETIALFILIPALIYGVVAAMVLLPGMIRGSRYRPTRGWNAAPVWFAGPPNPGEAVASAQTGDVTRGGASGSW